MVQSILEQLSCINSPLHFVLDLASPHSLTPLPHLSEPVPTTMTMPISFTKETRVSHSNKLSILRVPIVLIIFTSQLISICIFFSLTLHLYFLSLKLDYTNYDYIFFKKKHISEKSKLMILHHTFLICSRYLVLYMVHNDSTIYATNNYGGLLCTTHCTKCQKFPLKNLCSY